MEQRRERQRLEMQAGAAGAAGAADPNAVATVRRDELERMLKEQQTKNMAQARKRIKETVEMLRLLHCTALH